MKALLMGLPNVGKSTIFRRLVTQHVSVDSYPGTAVEVARGVLSSAGRDIEIVDSPGVHDLVFSGDHETVARSLLVDERPDLVIQVADAKNLQRSLVLTSLLAECGIPLVLVINMIDEAAQKGIEIRGARLEALLGTRVVETVASEGVGIGALIAALGHARTPGCASKLPRPVTDALSGLIGLMPATAGPAWGPRTLALLSVVDDRATARWAADRSAIGDVAAALALVDDARRALPQPLDLIISRANDNRAEAWYGATVRFRRVTSIPMLDRLGDLALTPVAGVMMLFGLLAALYFTVGRFAAGTLVDLLEDDLFRDTLGPYVAQAAASIPYPWVRDLISGDYGLYAMAVVPLFGLVLPVIVVFYLAFGLVEDSGYIPRLSILLDRLFRRVGLNGKAVLPIVLGFSCVTTATMATRVLDSKRERFIAIFLLSLGVPCSAKLSLILVMLAQVSLAAFLVVFGVVFGMTVLAGLVLNRLMPAQRSPFIMQVPPMRIPSAKNVVTRTSYRAWMFLKEASPLFVISAVGLFVMEKIGLLAVVERVAAPIVLGGWGLPPQFAESLIMGFIRGEAGIAVMKKMVDAHTMDHLQLVVAIIVTILFVPCVTNFMIIIKEQGSKRAAATIVLVTACATVTGGVVNHLFRWLNVTF
ncbi:MAG: ferrous iron transport protein B [Acidobacteriota bacterium]